MPYWGYGDTQKVDGMKVEVLNEVATHEVAAVELRVTVGSETVTVKGHAKKDPQDKPNSDLGLLLAYSRALEVASRRLNKRAQGHINHAEDLAEKKRRNKTNRTSVNIWSNVTTTS